MSYMCSVTFCDTHVIKTTQKQIGPYYFAKRVDSLVFKSPLMTSNSYFGRLCSKAAVTR